jgi:L-amino acid N-acyltransferase YncA
MDDFSLREYKSNDFEKILSLEREAFSILASPLEIKLSSFISKIFVIEKSDKIIGTVFFISILDFAYACNAAIKKEYRNKKIAQSFGPAILDKLRSDGIRLLTAIIQTSNKASLKMTANIGFKEGYKFSLPFLGDVVLVYTWL